MRWGAAPAPPMGWPSRSAVIEQLTSSRGARTLFATHYHELAAPG